MLRPSYNIFKSLILLFCSIQLNAQNNLEDAELILDKLSLNRALYPPEDILSSKSIVLFSVPEGEMANEWSQRLDELQKFFADQGVDAIAYVDQSTLFALPNQILPLPSYMQSRGIKNLILFMMTGNEEPMFLAIGPFNNQVNWWDPGANFWVRNPVEWDPLFEELDIYFKTGVLTNENHLVNDVPEYFEFDIENNFVFSSSLPRKISDLQIAAKAVNVDFYENQGPQIFSYQALFQNDEILGEMTRRAEELSAFAGDSTNVVELVNYVTPKRQLTRVGYDYELKWITGDFELINSFFKTKIEREPFVGERTVFYLEGLRRNDIFYGKEWAPKEDWVEALRFFQEKFGSFISTESQ